MHNLVLSTKYYLAHAKSKRSQEIVTVLLLKCYQKIRKNIQDTPLIRQVLSVTPITFLKNASLAFILLRTNRQNKIILPSLTLSCLKSSHRKFDPGWSSRFTMVHHVPCTTIFTNDWLIISIWLSVCSMPF